MGTVSAFRPSTPLTGKGNAMSTIAQLDPLAEALTRFERHLELPYVSGELSSWSEEAMTLFHQVEERLHDAVQKEHPKNYESIAKNRLDLQLEIEKLRECDAHLLHMLAELRRELELFQQNRKEEELAEQQFLPSRDHLVNNALAFVIQVRKQRSAIATWLSESIQRDNGVGD
jgi:hypothetical protein